MSRSTRPQPSYVVEPRERRMRADGTAPGRPAPGGPDPAEALRGCAREVLEVAEGIRAVAERTATTLRAPGLTATRRTGLAARWALLRALAGGGRGLGDPAGTTADGPHRGAARVLGAAGRALGGDSLAALVALTSLRLRVAAVLADHPELAYVPGMRLLTRALAADRDRDAVRALRALLHDRTAQRALSGLAPLISELLAVRDVLDGRSETGGAAGAEGGAEAVDLADQRRRALATEGSFLGFLRNIEVLSTDGRILVQNVRGPDGVVRYVLQAPWTAPGRPRSDAPQDLVGAWRDLCGTDSPYTRSLMRAVAGHGIPRGAELALIGHGEGGNAVLNLAQDEEFCRTYRVTHVIAVGSPVGDRKPADPRTWVATVTNQFDLVAAPDGSRPAPAAPATPAALTDPTTPAAPAFPADDTGPGSAKTPADHTARTASTPPADPTRPAPPPARPGRYDVEYAGPSREFPLCHRLREYIEHLRTLVPAARADIDEALTPYRGPVVRTQAYRLKDHAHPPAGHPFLTLATAPVRTTVGPVDVPVRYYDSAAAHLCFPVDPDAARSLLPDAAWLSPSRLGHRALAVLSVHEHRCTTIGPYTEIALSVLVDDLWRPRPYDAVTDLLRRVDLRRTGRYVLSLAVTTEAARVVAQEIWGQPALRMRVEADLTSRQIRARSQDLGLVVEGRLGPGVRCPDADRALYGRRATSTVRTLVRAHGGLRLHPGAGVRVRLGTAAAEPLAGQLRRLGIHAARPLFVLACPQFMAHRGGGAVLAR
ncbi:acetoacetate decarboxylase family protein [Streptomyces misionensis]|uniref:acetoacetate decarboxylase family protein n=1 Tax=Streptomyces misionensis TaxID=67331 RepID=UPI0033B65386